MKQSVRIGARGVALWALLISAGSCGDPDGEDGDDVGDGQSADVAPGPGPGPVTGPGFGGGDTDDGPPRLPEGECTTNAACVAMHPDLDPCLLALCDVGQGVCRVQERANFSSCDDGDACTKGSYCADGACVGGQNVVCFDGNPCTDDSCSPEEGCVFAPNDGACDDGNVCTPNDTCVDGECVGGPSTCPCVTGADCVEFEDGNPCNGKLFCSSAKFCEIAPGSVVVCPAESSGCLISQCSEQTGQCVKAPIADGTACSDGDACTVGDACLSGICTPAGALQCPESGPCLDVACLPQSGCQATQKTGPCDDGNPCTATALCVEGACVGQNNTCVCEDDADCAEYDDGNLCTGAVACLDGFCEVVPGTAVTCPPPAHDCLVVQCEPSTGSCVESTKPNGASCDDGDPCTTGDACIAGACKGAPVAGCGGCQSDADCVTDAPCLVGACGASGQCVFSELPGCSGCQSDADCVSGDPCVVGACGAGGQCAFSAVPECVPPCTGDAECADGNPCTAGVCTAGACVQSFVASACDDGDPCTGPGQCSEGSCAPGTPVVCDDGDPCTVGSCEPGTGCTYTKPNPNCCTSNGDCDDGYPCTVGICQAGSCTFPAKNCLSGTTCTLGYCGPQGACASVPSQSVSAPIVLYSEGFDHGSAPGWHLESANPESYFSVQANRAFSPPYALYGGNPDAWSYDFGVSKLIGRMPALFLPVGKLQLRFRVWMDVEQNMCNADLLYVGINGTALQPFQCESTGGAFVLREYDISNFGGGIGIITFFFETYSAQLNNGEGLYIDDVVITAEPAPGCP